jgi:uncharacterized protein (TIGR02391 family)
MRRVHLRSARDGKTVDLRPSQDTILGATMPSLSELIPNVDDLLSLPAEELAGPLLLHLKSLHPNNQQLNRHNFFLAFKTLFPSYASREEEATNALMEAWVWLEREGLLVPKPNAGHPEWVRVSRRGALMRDRVDFEAYRRGNLLPHKHLDPAIADRAFSNFLRGDYDTAVSLSFREVEIAVRRESGAGAEDYGTDLMRKAFHPQTGGLTDADALPGERQAISDLFAGAMGLFKNPTSHRRVTFGDPQHAAELIVFANLLLRIVGERAAARSK